MTRAGPSVVAAPVSPVGPGGRIRHVAIIGGGASGVLMAAHLLARSPEATVTILEPRRQLGWGLAYSTPDRLHLLNVRVRNMSAWPDDPEHLLRWLRAGGNTAITPDCFIGRPTYGAYLSSLLAPWSEDESRLTHRQATCTGLALHPEGVTLSLSDGETLTADLAILATGNTEPAPCGVLTAPWQAAPLPDPEARVVIVGTGLTMVDKVLSLLASGHRGPIVALSRRGLVPRDHMVTHPVHLTEADLPLGASCSRILAWMRGLAARTEAAGGTWQDAMDGIRHHVTALWRALPEVERRRFLRHAATWWDVHRHRMPPASAATLQAALFSGQLTLLRGAYLSATAAPEGVAVRYRTRKGEATPTAARVLDCRGTRRDPVDCGGPLLKGLLSSGAARLDPLRIGLDLDEASRVRAADGHAQERLVAIGPAARAAFWEIIAIPDIRLQVARIAERVAAV